MKLLTIDPLQYDVWAALPTYFLEQSPFYVKGEVTTPTALIEVVGHGIVAEAEVLLVERTKRPDDRYWIEESDDVDVYSLVDIMQLDIHHPILRAGQYGEDDRYEELKQKWAEGYRVPSAKWTHEAYEAHRLKERLVTNVTKTSVCSVCRHDLSERYGPEAYRLLEYHVTDADGEWLCPTCHKAAHCLY